VETSETLFTIADLSNLWVWCDLYGRDLAPVHDAIVAGKSFPATVHVEAYRDTAFPGSVDLVGSSLDAHTRTVKVRVQIENPDGRLRPGMFAEVEAQVPLGIYATLVPCTAVLSDAGETFVFQRWRDDLWIRRDVVVGRRQEDALEILSGLEEGTTVASGGAFMLKGELLRNKMGAG
jgi:multidrug efflux pump subunit AcrA (membrane-fusion protein)